MTLDEFAALKVGDKIENTFTHSQASIIEAAASGVRLVWDGTQTPFFYSVQGTSWFHWSKINEPAATTRKA